MSEKKSRRAANMRAALLWLNQQHDPPRPITRELRERFSLKKSDAFRVAHLWGQQKLGQPSKVKIPPFLGADAS
jgi:hypothetical protein